jgi:hypothetical protein
LSVMAFTGIEGGAYNAAKKQWLTKRTHAVESVVSVGKELPDGSIAEKNHIWFSPWQLDNINAGNLVAIELNVYTQLENNISKNLVPHLQEWLYASQRDGRFEKQYEDVCQLLGIRTYRYRSDIERQLAPSLNELVKHGYLSRWAIEPMADRKHYKLVLCHGPKYHSDRQARLDKKSRLEGGENAAAARRPRQRHLHLAPPTEPEQPVAIIHYRYLDELKNRGIEETAARKLLAELPADYDITATLEWADQQIAANPRKKWDNPSGFYFRLLQQRSKPPATFETSTQKKARLEATQAQQQARQQEQETRLAAEDAETAALNAQIEALSPDDRQALLSQCLAELISQHPNLAAYFKTHPEAIDEDGAIRARARNKLKTGWQPPQHTPTENPHQTINEPSGQATPLQEPAPADPLNLEAILSTPQLAPTVEQTPVEPTEAAPATIPDYLL